MVKVGTIILIFLIGFLCYCLCANSSRISRMEELYLMELEQKSKEENLKNK